jgi:ribonuclease PH
MFNFFRKELDWGGRKLILETGKVARQADGAVMIRYGDTIVLCTAVGVHTTKPGQDFFPLTVNYQEKTFAAGKIPGGFFKREGRPSEKEVLTSRLIDRPIRPLFAPGFLNETQVICTVLSHDLENDPDIVALVGASAALTLSGIPFMGPIAGARVGYIDGQYVLNPKIDDLKNSALDLIVAGTKEGVLTSCSAPSCSATRASSRCWTPSSNWPNPPPRILGTCPIPTRKRRSSSRNCAARSRPIWPRPMPNGRNRRAPTCWTGPRPRYPSCSRTKAIARWPASSSSRSRPRSCAARY